MRSLGLILALVVTLAVPVPASAELRINDLDVYLNDHEVTVHVVALGTLADGLHEGLQSGVPAHVRFTVELWQYSRFWRDRLVTTKVVERALDYNVVTKEYKVAVVRGESRAPYVTRDLRDAQRLLSELRGLKLVPAAELPSAEIFYVRVLAESALRGENTFVTRMNGTAAQTLRQSDYRTIVRSE
ncbi:MAG: DUF4390 domain-containing protein [Candidatus Rokubacteria bacterium]|nr:DUF4390 domain-containing protein [Candidatus Rokubacteria bacterium]